VLFAVVFVSLTILFREGALSKMHRGQKTCEKTLICQVRRFLSANSYIRPAECHFGRDSDELADVESALESARWPAQMQGYLSLEAKSHHSCGNRKASCPLAWPYPGTSRSKVKGERLHWLERTHVQARA
jgi:hypothetical protein